MDIKKDAEKLAEDVKEIVLTDIHNAGERTHQVLDHMGKIVSLLPGHTLALEKSIVDRLKRSYRELISPEDLGSGTALSELANVKLALDTMTKENADLKTSVETLTKENADLKNTKTSTVKA